MSVEQNLLKLGIELPEVSAPVANYVPGLAITGEMILIIVRIWAGIRLRSDLTRLFDRQVNHR